MAEKASGWGEAPPKNMQNIKNFWDAKETTIASIPTLNAASDTGTNVIAPPSAYVGNQVADLDKLNQKLVLPTKTEGGIDLSLLTSVVKPAEIVYERDELWDYQHLIIEIAQIIRNQKNEPQNTPEEIEPLDQFEMMPFDESSIL